MTGREATEQAADQAPEAEARSSAKRRVHVLAFVMLCASGMLVYRANAERSKGPVRWGDTVAVVAPRGTMYDRHGAILAQSIEVESLVIDPVRLRDAHRGKVEPTLRALARALSVDLGILQQRLRRRERWVEQDVPPCAVLAVRRLGLVGMGVSIRSRRKRIYPNGARAAHVIGFLDHAGEGQEGLERTFNTSLRGATDHVTTVKDARGETIFSDAQVPDALGKGKDLTLTLDLVIQNVVEHELERAVRVTRARSGHVVVMEPDTGAIVAMASHPTFDPASPGSDAEARRNRPVSEAFEPGSPIKVFTLAGALEAGVASSTQQIDCASGVLRIGGKIIHDSHPHGLLTLAEILKVSSNIGSAKLAAALGAARLEQTLRNFGFAEATGVDLPAESRGVLRDASQWAPFDTAAVSFGQGMSATNLQLATAMSAIANGGERMRPYVVSRIGDLDSEGSEDVGPLVRGRAVTPETARQVLQMLRGVTAPGGTGAAAAIEGVEVAGKTGTAQKADPRGGYAPDRWTATFVGVVPADHPRLVISVVVDEPATKHQGGAAAAPAFREIARQALQHLNGEAEGVLSSDARSGLAVPARGMVASRDRAPAVLSFARPDGRVRVPDLTGLGVRDAVAGLTELGLAPSLSGTGVAAAQSPTPGTLVDRGAVVRIVLRSLFLPPLNVPPEQPEGTTRKNAPAADRSLVGSP